MPDFLLEIGCEEIPARMIAAASLDLRTRVTDLLNRERLPASGAVTSFDTPRRLAIVAADIPATQSDLTEQVTGPSVAVAFKDGEPTPAAHAFAKKVGVNVAQLQKTTTPKGEYLSATVTKKGRAAAEVLVETLPKEMSSIYWPKSMYWRTTSERFVRPVRWIVAMLDGQAVPLEFDGVVAGKTSRGHRSSAQNAIVIPTVRDYVDALKTARVLPSDERLEQIRKALDAATRKVSGARWREDKGLLDTVVNLTEWPSVILGNFDREFLELSDEVLVTVMRDHQKYFAVEDASGKLLPHFLAVLNTDGDPSGVIQHGNERVLRARFNDARFFWQTDQKTPLRERGEWLKHVTFQKDLGTYYEKTLRMQRLASWMSEIVKQGGMAIRPGVVHKAAYLAKTDLTTELVKEFTELQGIVGGLYTRVQQVDPDVSESTRLLIADAVYDHYKPESMEDSVPRTIEGAVLSIADKADSIAGMFALGLIPTGSKDPFALRRQANGIVKTIAEYKLPFNLIQLLQDAKAGYRGSEAEKKFKGADFENSVRTFFRERLEFYLKDVRGFAYDVVKAVLAAGSDDLVDAVTRAEAVSKVRDLPDFQSIAAATKRMRNILRQAQEKGYQPAGSFASLATEVEEAKILSAKLEQMTAQVEKDRSEKNYVSALVTLGALREPVDLFFDKVMVMVEDEQVRANRLALLQTLLKEFSTIADFSEIVTEGQPGK